MQTRTRNALVLIAATAALSAGLAWVANQRKVADARSHALDAIPSGALLLATADLAALRASPVGVPFLREGREIPGLGKVRDVCGFDPMDTLSEVAVAIPAAGDAGEFGLVAAGAVDDEALLGCASKVITARGGTPVVTTIGSFRTVRDTGAAAGGEIAVRKGGPLLLGAGVYLRAMIDAADGRAPTIRASVAHTALAREAGEGSIKITMVLTPEQRQSLAADLALDGAGAPATSIAAVALGIQLGANVGLHGVIACDAADSAVRLAAALKAARDARASDLGTRIVGFGAALAQVQIDPRAELVHASVMLPSDQAAVLIERMMTLRGFRHPMPKEGELPAVPRPADAGAPSHAPDEVIAPANVP